MFNHDGDTSLYITYHWQQNTLESQMHFHTRFHQVTIICSVSQNVFFFFMSVPHRRQVWACNDPIYLSCHRNCRLWPKIQAPQLSSLSNQNILTSLPVHIMDLDSSGGLEDNKYALHFSWKHDGKSTANKARFCLCKVFHILRVSFWVYCGFYISTLRKMIGGLATMYCY